MSVTVIIVTCDRPFELKRAYNSVCNQTIVPDQVIIVNTGVTSADLDKGCIIVNAPGVGACEARNIGSKYAFGKYLAFLDDDDEWHNNKLESQLSMVREGVGIISSPYYSEDHIFKIEVGSILARNWIGSTSFPLILKSAFDFVGGFDNSFVSNQEWDLWIRVCKKYDVAICNDCAGIKHNSRRSISSNVVKRRRGWVTLLKKHLSEYRDNPVDFVSATYNFRDEMYFKRSVFGYICGFFWTLSANRTNSKMKRK